MSWDKLVNTTKAKARIVYRNNYLDQLSPKANQSLKMSINFQDNQTEKSKAIAS